MPLEPLVPLEPEPQEFEGLFPGKIAIITNDVTQNEEEYRSAAQIVAQYGEDKIIHKVWPVKFPEEGEQMIRIVRQIAAGPEVKALIINQAVMNTMAALDKLLEIRDDMFIVVIQPIENPPDVAARADLVLTVDELFMGPAMVRQAHKMGAKAFVHYSLSRHMYYPLLVGRRDLIKEECEKLAMEFIDATVAEQSDKGVRQILLENVPKMVEQYGKDTAFFCTACGLQIPLIMAVADEGAIYPQPCCPSPLHGFPPALDLASEFESALEKLGSIDNIITETTHILSEKNMLGRVSTWPTPTSMLFTQVGVEYAIKWLSGEVPQEGIDVTVLKQLMEDYAGVECYVRVYEDYEDDVKFENWFFVREEYLTYGEEK